MAAAEPGVVVPPAVEVGGEEKKPGWPPPEEQLEKWMMNTVKEGDSGARFLRTMLQMNPAYGTYLQTDADLVNVVQMFSKRIKTKISQFDTPANLPPQVLTQPLCEMVWRVVGYVMHGVIELEEEANMPVPKEASGMIRMLLHTNSQLSNKLNELRRVYLKELSEHRDKQRRISQVTARAVANLTEQPIMFFEPLEFVLDETTKDFVREAVAERMKLEMRTAFQNNDDNAEVTRYIEELEGQVELLKAEVKTCRATSNRLEEQMKTLSAKEQKQREDLKEARKDNEEKTKQIAEMEQQIKRMQNDINNKNRRIEHLEAKLGEAPTTTAPVEEAVQYDDHAEEIENMSQKIIDLEARNKEQADLIERLEKELAGLKGQGPKVIQGEDRVVYQDDPETKRLLEQALQVEKELRAANEALERALAESEREAAELRIELGKKPVAPKEVAKVAAPVKNKKDKGPSAEEMEAMKNAELEKALRKVNAAHEKKVQEMQDMIDKLTAQLEKVKTELSDLQDLMNSEPKAQKAKVVKQIGVPEEEHTKLKVRVYELEQKIEKMEDEYALLEQKVQMLMDKLKEKFSDAELGEILEKIKLAPPPLRKHKKKKAWERLYDDAQRRIIEMKMRQEKLKELEERSLRNMARIVANSKDSRKVEMLNHLHQANQQTSQRFHDALVSFQMSRTKSGQLTGLEGDEYDSEEEVRRIDRLSDLEQMTIECFKDGVCPRCAFSALATFTMARKAAAPVQMGSGLTFAGSQSGASFGTPWDPTGAASPAAKGRMRMPPWDPMGRPDTSGSRRSGASSGSPKGRAASPLGAGPAPGAMPFDTAFPMPAPPWRPAPADAAAGGGAPWRQQDIGNSAVSSSGPLLPKAAMGGPEAAGGGLEVASRPLEAAARGITVDTMVPPWRRDRSDSPVNRRSPSPKMGHPQPVRERGPVAQPPSGVAPPGPPLQQRGIVPTPSIGKFGRPPGPDWSAPVPGRVPAAQTMALDPIVRSHGSSRSPSPGREQGVKKFQTDGGFRKMRTPHDMSTQIEVEGQGRPNTVPPFGKPPRGVEDQGQAGGTHFTMGGGGLGTQYKNVGTAQLPTMPGTRSMPNIPVAGNTASMPWHRDRQEVSLDGTPASKSTSKAKKGPGFVVAPVASQERLASGNATDPS